MKNLIRYVCALCCALAGAVHLEAQTITDAEYFFDTDPGFGLGTAITFSASAEIDESLSISAAGLSPGFHKLFVRSKDSDGLWGLTEFRTFHVQETTATVEPMEVVTGEYFFNADPGIGNGTAVTITAGAEVDINFDANTTGLTSGFQTLFLRVQDDLGFWSVSEGRPFYIQDDGASATATEVVAAEYFFDTDPGFGAGNIISLTSGNDLDISFDAVTSSLVAGFHNLYVRVQDDLGAWSLVEARSFYIQADNSTVAPTMVSAAEYFIDIDPGLGAGTSITLSATTAEIDEALSIDMTGLSQGFHRLFIRVQDDLGKWSIAEGKSFHVQTANSTAQALVVEAAEYFFDTDPGVGNGISIDLSASAAEIEESIEIPTSFTAGAHQLIVRVQDDLGRWSIAEQRDFNVFAGPVSNDNSLDLEEDIALPIVEADFRYNSSGTTFTRVVIETVPSSGDLMVSTTPVSLGQEIAVADFVNLSYLPDTDFNGADSFTFTVGDASQLSAVTSTMSLSVSAINDPPSFSTSADLELLQDFTGSAFVFMTPDSRPSDEVGQVVTYSMNPSTVPFANVSIDAGSGLVTVTSVTGQVGTQEITVIADDGEAENSTFESTFNLTVGEINDAPEIANQTLAVDENVGTGTSVGTVVATDADGSIVSFTILSGNSLAGFAIGSDGELTVDDASVLDFESNPTFFLVVEVEDDSEATASATVTVNLNDVNDAPVIAEQTLSVNEDALNAASVGFVSSTDQDGDALTFSITAGNDAGVFSINASSGEITVADMAGLDFESNPSFVLTVSVADGVLSAAADITITVIEVDEVPITSDATFTIDEGLANGTSIGFVDGSDPEGELLTFTITSGNDLGGFALNPSTGEITVASQGVLDFDTNPTFSLAVNVSDGQLSADATITINVSEVLGTDDTPTITVFPNPTEDKLIISGTVGPYMLTLVDLSGKEIIKGENVGEISLKGYTSGTYLVTIEEDGKIPLTIRIVKKN